MTNLWLLFLGEGFFLCFFMLYLISFPFLPFYLSFDFVYTHLTSSDTIPIYVIEDPCTHFERISLGGIALFSFKMTFNAGSFISVTENSSFFLTFPRLYSFLWFLLRRKADKLWIVLNFLSPAEHARFLKHLLRFELFYNSFIEVLSSCMWFVYRRSQNWTGQNTRQKDRMPLILPKKGTAGSTLLFRTRL